MCDNAKTLCTKQCGAQEKRECGVLDNYFRLTGPHQWSILHSLISNPPRVIKAESYLLLVVLNDIPHHKARPLWNAVIPACLAQSLNSSSFKLVRDQYMSRSPYLGH